MKSSVLPPDLSASEPVRLLAGGGNELDRRLLQSARLDRVPDAAALRVAQSLGLPALAVPPSTGSPNGITSPPKGRVNPRLVPAGAGAGIAVQNGAPPLARLASWGGLGFFGVVGALVVRQLVQHPHVEATPAASPAPVAAVTASAVTASAVTASAVTETAAASVPAIRDSEVPATTERGVAARGTLRTPLAPEPDQLPTARTAARQRPPSPARPGMAPAARGMGPVLLRPAAPPARNLVAEVHQLEAVQHALQAGQTKEAARGLVAYRARFPKGELGLEAELLNVDVTLAEGQPARARALARALAQRPDAARYRARLDALLAATASSGADAPSPVLHDH